MHITMLSFKRHFEIILECLIISILMNDIIVVNGINVYMNDNITASAGEDDIEIKCSYTLENIKTIFTVALLARNKTNHAILFSIVTFLPDATTVITPSGKYLCGRVTIRNITQESTEATMILNELKCTDQNQYRCTVTYLNTNDEVDSKMSLPTTINVTANPHKPHISNFTKRTKKERRILTNMTNDVINRTEIYREGDIVTFVCTGNVGRPPGNILWQKMYLHETKSLTYDKETMQTEAFYWECSFNITSYFTIQLSANDFNARIRCVVVSPHGNGSLYVDTVPLNLHFGVRHVFINTLPERQIFDTTINNITLMCNTDGNPKPTYTWYKRKNKNTILSTSNKYVINDVIQNNSGTYICEVYNFISGETYSASTSVEIAIVENTENGEHSLRNDSNTEVSAIVAVLCGLLAVIIIVLVVWISHKYIQKCRRNNNKYNSTESNHVEMNTHDTIGDIALYEKAGPLEQRPYNELHVGQIFKCEDCRDECRISNKYNDQTKLNDRSTSSYDTIDMIEDQSTYEMEGQEHIINGPEILTEVGHSCSNLQF